jgi:ubiquinone/menaquinone biosynthesis C-methylase UbiE
MTSTTFVDFDAVKTKQRATWGTGDYSVIGTTLQITGETLCEAVDVEAGQRVLDVAAGNGNAALAAARRGAVVTAVDYVPALLNAGQNRASADGLTIDSREADAEALPFEAATFDVVLSTFGVMFTPNQERAAAELLRVCRPGGRIGLVNWTPGGFIGQMFRIVGRYAPPPDGLRSPLQWGTEDRLAELFGGQVSSIEARPRSFHFRYRSPQDWLNTFRTYYGPTARAFAALDEASQRAFEQELLELAARLNTSTTGALRVPSEYLEVVAVRSA